MKVSIISPVIYAGSTAVDPAFRLSDLVQQNRPIEITKGLEIQEGTDVYEYQLEDSFIPPLFESIEHNIGDCVFKDAKLYKITGKSGLPANEATRPKEPEEYDGWDDIANFENATHRYFRISNTHIADHTMGSLGINKARWYYIFWEDRPHHPNCGYRFSAKDLNKTGTRDASWYQRSCLRNATSTSFEASKDFKAVVSNWGAPNSPKTPTLNCKNLIIRGDYAYLRTQLDLPVEYTANTTGTAIQYSLTEIQSPEDIKGFIRKRSINALAVFDKKDYTKFDSYPDAGFESFSFYNTDDFDCIALGKLIADSIDIEITTTDGASLFTLQNYPVDNNLSKSRFQQGITGIIYTPNVIAEEALVTITLKGSHVSLGDISVGDTLRMGYTNLEFQNDYRDFSPYEQDQWGNILYVDGVRVKRHTGTVDLEIKDYDLIYRQMDAIGGNEVIINGSDSTSNTPPNSISIFQSTMMVGRFKSIKLATKAKTNKIGDVATYTFEVQERV